MTMCSGWSLRGIVMLWLQAFSWGIVISCSQSERVIQLWGRNPKQAKGADIIFSFMFILRTNQFTFLHYEKKKIFIPPWIEVWCYYTRWFLLKFHGTMTLLHFLRMDFKTQWPTLPDNGSLKFEGSICHMEEAPESPETYWVLALTVYPWCFPDVFLLPPTRHKLKVKVNQATPIRHVLCMEGCQWDMVGHGEGGKKISVILNKFRWA